MIQIGIQAGQQIPNAETRPLVTLAFFVIEGHIVLNVAETEYHIALEDLEDTVKILASLLPVSHCASKG